MPVNKRINKYILLNKYPDKFPTAFLRDWYHENCRTCKKHFI